MSTVVIQTPRLELRLQTPEETLAGVESLPPEDRAQVSPDWIAQVRATTSGDPWSLSFSAIERATGATVGSCGFKGPPDADGTVEIAYGTEPEFRGRGFATEAARALTDFACADGRVRFVHAHTKAENGASVRVLTKCGFRFVGEVIDPEDGPVLRWMHEANASRPRQDSDV